MAQNPLYQRAMFSGAPQVTPQSSLGTGITSGLIDEPSPMDQQEGEMGMLAMSGIESAAQGLQEMFGEIDEAEDIESMINTVRGDQKSMKQRYSELADLVGRADANKTPESVLALLQPTFQIMETLQGGLPEGGIAGLMGGEEEAIQAPGTEEAMMRMMAGEQPVMRQSGSPPFGEIAVPGMRPFNVLQNPNMPFMMNNTVTPKGVADYNAMPQFDPNQYQYLQGLTPPDKRMVDPAKAGQLMSEYMSFMQPYLPEVRSAEDLQTEYKSLLDPYVQQPRSREEQLAEAQQFFGAGDKDAQDIQAALALARAGSVIAQTPGSILQSLTAGGGQLAGDLSKIASEKATQDRQLKQYAFQNEQKEAGEFRQQQFQIASQAIQQSNADQNNWNSARQAIAQDAFTKGLSTETINSDRFNDAGLAAWTANNQFAVLPAEPFVTTNAEGKSEVFTAQKTADGYRRVTRNGLEEMPESFMPLDSNTAKTLTGNGSLDLSDAQKTNLLIPDSGSLAGYKGVPGFFLNGSYFITPDGNVANAQLAPNGFMVGDERDAITVTQPDSVGRVFVIPNIGDNAGRRILAKAPDYRDADGNLITGAPTGGLAFELAPAKYEGDKVVEGNPLVEQIAPTGIRYENLTPEQVGNLNERILRNVDALQEGQNVLNYIRDAVGPYNSMKAFLSNNVASIFPEANKEFFQWTKTTTGRDVMDQFVRKITAANALSDRYAVAEQDIIRQLAVDPNIIFQDEDKALHQFGQLMRVMYNDLSFARGVVSDSPSYYLPTLPTGNESDPYDYNDKTIDYLNMLQEGGALPADTYVQMTVQQAQQAGMNPTLYRNRNPSDTIKVRYGQLP